MAPGFKACALKLRSGPHEIDVQIHRYVPGPLGNRGWIEILRTGPREFGQAFLVKHKMRQGIHGCGSKDGYLVGGDGAAIPTPTEADAFRVCGLEFIAPEKREGAESVRWAAG